MSLYTKYRPRDWDSVIGQDRIKTILQNSLTHDRVGHAYLFHGSRGTGKTTSARILAKGVNCTHLQNGNPCHECTNCQAFDNGTMLDVIEIDAASNTGVDNIRDLIERARFEPNQGKYKVYIIDEVHMLSTGAFNALLKTLEEPPAHVKFILATTEIDKVPETIRSRSLRFDFRKIIESDIVKRLGFVIHEENIRAEDGAIQLIAKYARGALRDALTLLEQNTIDSELSIEHIRMTLSLLDEREIDKIIETIHQADRVSLFTTIDYLRDMHINARAFFEQLMYRLRDLMIEHIDDSMFHEYQEMYDTLEGAYTRVRLIPDGMLLIEITLLKMIKKDGSQSQKTQDLPRTTKNHTNPPPIPQPIPPTENPIPSHALPTTLQHDSEAQPSHTPPLIQHTSHPPFSYITFLDRIKQKKPALVIDLKTARFEEKDHALTLIFVKNWNYTRVNTPEIRGMITEVLEETFGGVWSIECRLDTGINTNIADDVFYQNKRGSKASF